MDRSRGVRKTSVQLIVLSLAIALFAARPVAWGQNSLMTHHLPGAVQTGRAKALGALPEGQTLRLSILLPPRNQAALAGLLQELYDPGSPRYHQWLSVEEFSDRFGPAEADYDALIGFAEANGMAVITESSNRMVLDVQGSVGDVNRVFHVKLTEYQHPTEERTFYAPDREPSVSLQTPLWRVAGLEDYSKPRSALRIARPAEVKDAITGSGPGGGFLGSDIRAAYYGGDVLTGAGQTIGLFGLNYNLSDVELYYSTIGQPFNPASVQNYSTDGTANSCDPCDDGEPVIDIYEALSMAPDATVIEYFGSSDVDTLNAMATHNVARQLSASVLWLPADPNSDEPIFEEFAAQGQSYFQAAGDSGAYNSSNPSWYPAGDPYVTSVGGTDLATTGAGGAWASESAWVGSGGGINTNGFAIPSYQQAPGVIDAANGGSTTLRNIPDVAAEANTDNYTCMNGSCGVGVGGTSLAAPRWAGFTALINQQAAINGANPPGFMNPLLYALGSGSSRDSVLHDIVSGNNGDGSGSSFNAVAGYDLATGWGSPGGQGLIDAISGTPTSGEGYGLHGIYTDGTEFSNGGLDRDGGAYSANLLGSSLSWNGTSLPFGTPNTANAFSGQTIALPSGNFGSLNLLGAAVNGSQTGQTFTVTYADGSQTTYTQSLSDWFTPQGYPGEATVRSMPYRDDSGGGRQDATFNLYGYTLPLNSGKVLKSLTLPANRNVTVLSVVPGLSGGSYTLAPQSAPTTRLDDHFSSTSAGNSIDIWGANQTGAQSWVFSSVNVAPSGYYNLAVSYGPYCMTASGSSSGALVELDPCDGDPAQAWQAVPYGNAFVFHPSSNTGLCLDVQDDGTGWGTLVDAAACNYRSNQQWVLN